MEQDFALTRCIAVWRARPDMFGVQDEATVKGTIAGDSQEWYIRLAIPCSRPLISSQCHFKLCAAPFLLERYSLRKHQDGVI